MDLLIVVTRSEQTTTIPLTQVTLSTRIGNLTFISIAARLCIAQNSASVTRLQEGHRASTDVRSVASARAAAKIIRSSPPAYASSNRPYFNADSHLECPQAGKGAPAMNGFVWALADRPLCKARMHPSPLSMIQHLPDRAQTAAIPCGDTTVAALSHCLSPTNDPRGAGGYPLHRAVSSPAKGNIPPCFFRAGERCYKSLERKAKINRKAAEIRRFSARCFSGRQERGLAEMLRWPENQREADQHYRANQDDRPVATDHERLGRRAVRHREADRDHPGIAAER